MSVGRWREWGSEVASGEWWVARRECESCPLLVTRHTSLVTRHFWENGINGMNDIKRIPVALIAALMVQTVSGLIWAGGAAARIATLEARVGEQRLVAERLARLEEQSLATRRAVERIERVLVASGEWRVTSASGEEQADGF